MKRIQDEKGSMTVEFMAVLPLIFLLLLICWQFLVGAYAVVATKSAVNEAAKVYAITEDAGKAQAAAEKVIQANDHILSYEGSTISSPDSEGYFDVEIEVKLALVFLPGIIKNNLPANRQFVSFEEEIQSRVIR
ncbi:TadE/TadG family type IV pilus assembly protein [Bacillus tianshenii]|nr:TadE/TadG family type IV pilus assembly protein [Bacillus tianshenii]